jgi:hypothetical protein
LRIIVAQKQQKEAGSTCHSSFFAKKRPERTITQKKYIDLQPTTTHAEREGKSPEAK